MPIEHTCPSCQMRLRVADESAGKKVRCKCGAVSAVASGTTPAVAAAGIAPARTTTSGAPAAAAPSSSQSIAITCSNCQQTLRAPQSAAGKAVRCKCGQVVPVPAAKSPAPAAKTSAKPTAATAATAAAKPVAKPAATPVANKPAAKTAVAAAPARQAAAVPVARAAAAAPVGVMTPPAQPAGSIFDELTDADWNRESPIARAYAPPVASRDGAVLKQFVGKEMPSAKKQQGSIPGGLIALSVINFIGSAFYVFVGAAIIVLVQVAAVMEQLETVFPAIRLAASIFCVYFIVWGIYLSVVGVGLLQRAPWGWCVAGVSYAHAIVDRIYNVVIACTDGIPPAKIGGMIGGTMVIVGITAYIYKDETRRHFGLKSMTPVIVSATIGVAIAILTIIAITVFSQGAEGMIPADANAG